MQAWYINLLCTAGNVGLDVQCDIVITQAVGEYLFENVSAVQCSLAGTGDVVIDFNREGTLNIANTSFIIQLNS